MNEGHGESDGAVLITADMLAPRPAARADGRIDFERGMRRVPPVVLTIIAVNVAVFAWEVGSGAFVDRKALLDAGAAAAGSNLLEAGAPGRAPRFSRGWGGLITPQFPSGRARPPLRQIYPP